jgi:hypothetical protein
MAPVMPRDIFDKLEREWRLIEPDRKEPDQKPVPDTIPKRLKISRVD